MRLFCSHSTPFVVVACVLFGAIAVADDCLSPESVAVARGDASVYIAELTASRVAEVDIAQGNVLREIQTSVMPAGLAVSHVDGTIFVTGGDLQGKALALDPKSGGEVASISIGHTPVSPVVSQDGKTLYVCNRFNNDISVLDIAARKEITRIPVLREPVAAALAPDGRCLVVVNHLPVGPSNGSVIAAAVSMIDTKENRVAKNIELPNGASGMRGVCISPDGRFAYVTHILARYQLPTTQLERGWMNTNALSVIDIAGQKLVNTILLDEAELGAANPWSVVCTSDGRFICVAHAGTNEISVVDAPALLGKLEMLAAGKAVSEISRKPEDVPTDLAFLVDMRKRIPLSGNGSRGIAAVGHTLVVTEYFSDTVSVVEASLGSSPKPRQIPLGPQKEMSVVRKGEMLFNSADLCFQHWQSCASCHPDSRADSLNWDLLNDGMGNPKNTKSMLYSHQTPPVMSHGVRDSAETAVRSGIKYIQFAVRPDEDAKAIDEYLKSMKPVPSPYAVEAAQRGKTVFESAGCSQCHTPPYGTDLKSYDVGTATDERKDLDTPALTEIWRTAPYLHDGRAATIMEVLTKFNKGDLHGKTSDLSQDQLKDLAAYVLSY